MCADSRIVLSLMIHTGPGELFIEHNPGNIVPVYEEISVGVSASIEYAIAALGTKHVIVCGHSDCGAVSGMLYPEKLAAMPAVSRWLGHSAAAVRRLTCDGGASDEASRLHRLTRLNVVVQMENLRSHPSVQRAMAAGVLRIYGWVHDIETGAVQAYDEKIGQFIEFPWAPQPSMSI